MAGEQARYGRRVLPGDLADNSRAAASTRRPPASTASSAPSTSILSTSGAGNRAASQSRVTVVTSRVERTPPAIARAEARQVARRAVTARDMEPGDRQVIGYRGGQDFHRRVPGRAGRRAAEQADQVGVGLHRQHAPFRARHDRRREAEQPHVGADVPHGVAGPDYLGREPQQRRVDLGPSCARGSAGRLRSRRRSSQPRTAAEAAWGRRRDGTPAQAPAAGSCRLRVVMSPLPAAPYSSPRPRNDQRLLRASVYNRRVIYHGGSIVAA